MKVYVVAYGDHWDHNLDVVYRSRDMADEHLRRFPRRNLEQDPNLEPGYWADSGHVIETELYEGVPESQSDIPIAMCSDRR